MGSGSSESDISSPEGKKLCQNSPTSDSISVEAFTDESATAQNMKKITTQLEGISSRLDGVETKVGKLEGLFDNALICEGKFTVAECFKSLQLFENNKSPGLTVEFYKAFWNIVGNLMGERLNYSYDHGEMSNSQKQAIITLVEKKDKDRRDI